MAAPPSRRIFAYAEARALIPELRAATAQVAARFDALRHAQRSARLRVDRDAAERAMRAEVKAWQTTVRDLGACCAGLWLVRFDSGAGWFCWQHPEPDLLWFYDYESGFAGRRRVH